jgi:hypothetical protein
VMQKLFAAIALTMAVTGTHAAVVTFEGITGAGANVNNGGLILTADPGSFDWTGNASNIQLIDETRATGNKGLTNIAALMGSSGEVLGQWVGYINSTDSVSFASATAFDFTDAFFYAKAATTVNITGYGSDGVTVLGTKSISMTAQSGNTYSLSEFSGVNSVKIAAANLVFDNITTVVSAVPEASSYAMLLAGLGMIGVIARRRTNR